MHADSSAFKTNNTTRLGAEFREEVAVLDSDDSTSMKELELHSRVELSRSSFERSTLLCPSAAQPSAMRNDLRTIAVPGAAAHP